MNMYIPIGPVPTLYSSKDLMPPLEYKEAADKRMFFATGRETRLVFIVLATRSTYTGTYN